MANFLMSIGLEHVFVLLLYRDTTIASRTTEGQQLYIGLITLN